MGGGLHRQASKDTVEQQARLLEEKNRGLANRLKEIESSSQAEIEHHRRERQRTEAVVRSAAPPPPPPPPAPGNDDSIREEYEGLLKELTDAGLKDPHDVDRLLTALKGPPVTDANAVRSWPEVWDWIKWTRRGSATTEVRLGICRWWHCLARCATQV